MSKFAQSVTCNLSALVIIAYFINVNKSSTAIFIKFVNVVGISINFLISSKNSMDVKEVNIVRLLFKHMPNVQGVFDI